MVNQDLKPVKWLIINDNSSDNTLDILEKVSNQYEWIDYITISDENFIGESRRIGYLCKKGSDYLIRKCKEEGIKFQFIGKVDADTIFPQYYFADVIKFLDSNTQVGLVAGILKLKLKGPDISEERIEIGELCGDRIRGTGIIFRKEAYYDIGGIRAVKAEDSVANILLREKGWEIKQLKNLEYWQTRETGRKTSIRQGFTSRGKRKYYLNTNLLSVLGTAFQYLFYRNKPFLKAFYFILGYFVALINKEEQIDIKIVREWNGSYTLFIKRLIKRTELIKK